MSEIEQIKEQMKKHDWFFEWSDDHSYYTSGKRHKEIILNMVLDSGLTKDSFNKLIDEVCPAELRDAWRKEYERIHSK